MTISGELCSSSGFWATTPPAQVAAASTHSAAPQLGARSPSAVASPMTTAPAKATAQPTSSVRGKPSLSTTPASSAMKTGPTLTSIAAVPASIRRSASLRAML